MNNNFALFLLISVLVTGTVVYPSFAEEPPVNGTGDNDTNSTSTEESMIIDDKIEYEITKDEDVMEDEEEMLEDENMINDEDMMEDEMPESVLSPLKQIKDGILPENVVCKEGLSLVFKINGQPACIQTASVEKLVAWGWAQ